MLENSYGDIKILATFAQLQDNPEDRESFLKNIDEIELHLTKTRRGFKRNLDGNPQWVQDKCAEETEAVYNYIDKYHELLAAARDIAGNFDENRVGELKAGFTEVIDSLNGAFIAFREALLSSWGPFEHGNINLLIAMAYKAKSLEESIVEVRQEIMPLILLEEGMIASLHAAEESVLKNEMIGWQSDFLNLLENSRKIASDELDAFIEELHILGNRNYAMNLAKMAEYYVAENTVLPVSDLVLECSMLYVKGYLSPLMFREVLLLFESMMEQIKSLVPLNIGEETYDSDEACIENKGLDTSQLIDSLTKIETALSAYYDGIDNSVTELDDVNELLQQGIDLFGKAMEYLELLSEREGKTPCIRCGAYSHSHFKFCEKCNAPLNPLIMGGRSTVEVMDDDSGESVIVMTTNIERIFSAAEGFFSGEVTSQQFLSEVDKFGKLLAKAKQMAPGTDNEDEILRQAAESYLQGLNEISEGHSVFKLLLSNPSQQTLDRAKSLVWSGAGILQEMQKTLNPYIGN